MSAQTISGQNARYYKPKSLINVLYLTEFFSVLSVNNLRYSSSTNHTKYWWSLTFMSMTLLYPKNFPKTQSKRKNL